MGGTEVSNRTMARGSDQSKSGELGSNMMHRNGRSPTSSLKSACALNALLDVPSERLSASVNSIHFVGSHVPPGFPSSSTRHPVTAAIVSKPLRISLVTWLLERPRCAACTQAWLSQPLNTATVRRSMPFGHNLDASQIAIPRAIFSKIVLSTSPDSGLVALSIAFLGHSITT